METPEWLKKIIVEAVDSTDGKNEAIAVANRRARKHAEFPPLVDVLVTEAIARLVGDERHSQNTEQKITAGKYCRGQLAPPEDCPDIAKGLGKVLRMRYFLGGRILGDLAGTDLDAIGDAEQNRANGHMFNARLCRKLRETVPDDKRVREVFTERRLDKVFRELESVTHC